ncbi:50S ribosomal protein L24 [Picrophilus oshimae]|uniref:Large ribosomal subunit protein uL24 n=1 Tax=Picrophilus torridus (strain ATCC 700027 / DSM 9790 / JCM 10055 / NBRC 100828 / KAW 2/3) TaxID=1122961 RepID=RL24_PICTO|nr:50S ribosomal protein L24 [Picrophilus oshimae]Q6L1B6.1 RecName: Full=Large ribosomal subunit protein uL24; AltName: Full=50S ribosomal protein L24 [Picrophilus oshimae DSM 9789]AAT43236.1 large subunit ribosomal protein L24P [Picrophilus oshimae DSM 9789]
MINNKVNVSLSKDLRKKYGIRRFPVAKGDIVKIISGSRKGEGGKVVDVDHKTMKVSIEGVTISKADGKQVPFFIDHSNISITKLDLSRNDRYERLREIAARKNLPPPEVPEETSNDTKESDENVTGADKEETNEIKEEDLNDNEDKNNDGSQEA